jgi:hypothetical protein
MKSLIIDSFTDRMFKGCNPAVGHVYQRIGPLVLSGHPVDRAADPMGEHLGIGEAVGKEVRNIKPGQFVVGSYGVVLVSSQEDNCKHQCPSHRGIDVHALQDPLCLPRLFNRDKYVPPIDPAATAS